ncbi:MAG: 4-alpha-glucanotransferase [Anaerolineaceae bacterium]|nr:4-alpha-glucanotransferase [Anaerolineaceae bacterium]
MVFSRNSGVLLHPTSFAGPYGIGDLGPEAYRWVDFLKKSGTRFWQILPLGPTGYGDSPYQCFSAFAGNPLLISPDLLMDQGLLEPKDLRLKPRFPKEKVDFGPLILWKSKLLDKAFKRFEAVSTKSDLAAEFESFRREESSWLKDYALFMAIKQSQGGAPWGSWPEALKKRESKALKAFQKQFAGEIIKHEFNQFLFFRQWQNLHGYASSKGIQIIGDMPFVISMDSADAWTHPELFLMDADLKPTQVAGVPPDYFSSTGQLWGNPLYKWELHQKQKFLWWVRRLSAVLKMVDLVRLDHFRGFAAAWHVPFGNETAIHGQWIPGPAKALFSAFKKHFPHLPIIAEDLGVITADVEELRDGFGLPGMKILQFGFTGDPDDDFLPHNYPVHCFAYTGSHDNNTAQGWFDQATPREQAWCRNYLNAPAGSIAWPMIRALWASVAANVLVPMQDLLALGSETRMNLPGSQSGNWAWRMQAKDLSDNLAFRLKDLNFTYARLPEEEKEVFRRHLEESTAQSVKPH